MFFGFVQQGGGSGPPMSDTQWLEWLRATGGTGAVFLGGFLIGLIRGWWYLRREMEAIRAERDEWKSTALRNTNNLKSAVAVAAKVVEGQQR